MRYLCNVTYDGKDYYGSQVQKDKKTIEGEIERVFSKVLNHKVNIILSSRTDRKVHAYSSYFHFDEDKCINEDKLLTSVNKLINKDIYIKSIKKVSDDFHARYSVKSKEYLYVINTGIYNPLMKDYELEYNKKIDIRLLKKASKYLIGTHDFKSFTSDSLDKNSVRTINYIKIEEKNELVKIYINGNGFLKYMVRNIVGLLLEINENKKRIKDVEVILESKDRCKLGVKASPEGLYLNKVNY